MSTPRPTRPIPSGFKRKRTPSPTNTDKTDPKRARPDPGPAPPTAGPSTAGPSTAAGASAAPGNGGAAAAGSSTSGGGTSGEGTSGGGEGAGGGGGRQRPKRRREVVLPQMKDLTETAFHRWIRVLIGALEATETLGLADEYITHFEARYEPVDDLRAHIKDLVEKSKKPNAEIKKRAARLLKEVKTSLEQQGQQAQHAQQAQGRIASDVSKIPHEALEPAFAAIVNTGLLRFYPDVFGNTSSAYNQLHRHLAVSTFQAAAAGLGLTQLQVSLRTANDTNFLYDVYNKFMSSLTAVSKRKMRNPESLEESKETAATKKRMERVHLHFISFLCTLLKLFLSQLCKARYEQAKTDQLRTRLVRAIGNPQCHSDDEILATPLVIPRHGKKPLKITSQARQKVGRHPGLTSIIRDLDVKILAKYERNPRGPRPDSRRTDELLPPSSISTELPKAIYRRPKGTHDILTPLDFFSPAYFNETLDAEEKSRYANHGVALAAMQDELWQPESRVAWMTMGKEEFSQTYEEEALAQYELPTEEQIKEARVRRERAKKVVDEEYEDLETDLDSSEDEAAMNEDEDDADASAK
uniref:Uncharacterized protein n=1 Tax=Mycena chlorophos TaxID=658473 RepID=A0ABQ0MCR1_MYCCL|nr:predicted protein [Mycena chlorophos]